MITYFLHLLKMITYSIAVFSEEKNVVIITAVYLLSYFTD